MRDKLIELLIEANDIVKRNGFDFNAFVMADKLLAEGVIVPPCKAGDTVWVLNQSRGAIYENTVVCIKVASESRYKNTIRVEYHNTMGEASYRKFTWAQIGRQVFLTKEEAEKALAERNENGNN